MIDLHMHTHYSDGQYSVEEVLKKCQEIGLDVISITDHDSVGAYFELEQKPELQKIFKGILIPGTELSFNKNNRLFDVLGYDIDYKKMQILLDKRFSEEKRKNMQRTLLDEWKQVCKKLGISFNDLLKTTDGASHEAFNVLFADISDFTNHPENEKFSNYIAKENIATFYKKCFSNPDSEFFVNEARFSPSLKEAIEMIHECGGKAFLAHSFAYGLENPEDFIEWAIGEGLDGLEKFYSTHTKDHENIIANIANNRRLYISGGTDFHGPNVKPGIAIGTGKGNMKIPNYIIFPWAKLKHPDLEHLKDK